MIYLFYGDDTLTLLQELWTLKEKFIQKHSRQAVEELAIDAQTTDGGLRAALQGLLENPSLFALKKLVVLRDFLNELHDYPAAEAYLLTALGKLGSAVTVVFSQLQPVDRRLRFFKKLWGLATTKEFTVPSEKALETWIKNRLKKDGYEIEKPALQELLAALGAEFEMWQVEGELQKLMFYRQNDKTIKLPEVKELVSRNISASVFDLTNLVAEGKIPAAVALLEQMIATAPATDSKDRIIQIVGALASQIRSLLLVKDLEREHQSAEIAKILDWQAGRVWINLKLAAKFNKEKLIQLLLDLKAIDFRLKTSEEPPKLLLTLFFQKAAA